VDDEEDASVETSLIRSEELREKEERKETRRRYFSAQQVSPDPSEADRIALNGC
jgi:hypothetical protein